MFFQNVSIKLYFLFSDFNKAEKLNEINNLEGVLLFQNCNGDLATSILYNVAASLLTITISCPMSSFSKLSESR